MGLPPLAKAWDFAAINRRLPARSTANVSFANATTLQQLLRVTKDQLKTWGWTVRGSCGGLAAPAAAMDGVDRWGADEDLLWGHPSFESSIGWIVLERADAAGPGLDLEVLIWLRATVAGRRATELAAFASYGGFSGGTLTARPTAADEVQIRGTGGAAAPWTSLAASSTRNASCWLHAIRSTDGEVHRIFAAADGVLLFYFAAERARSPVSAWTHPLALTWQLEASYAAWNAAPAFVGFDGAGTPAWMPLYASTSGAAAQAHGTLVPIAGTVDGAAFTGAIGLVSDLATKRGRHGGLYDAWFLPQAAATADTYPPVGAQLAVAGDVALPWDGSSPLRTT